MRFTSKILAVFSLTVGFAIPGWAHGHGSYPERPVKIIVPWGAGSGIDVQVRQFAQQFAETLGGTVIVENRSGAGSQLGYEAAARAEPDGYTLFAGTNANFIHQYMRPSSNIDPVRDLAPISFLFWMPSVLVVAADSPAQDVAELLAWAKSRPGELNYGSGGVGAASHLLASTIVSRNGLSVEHVPLRTLTADLGPMLSRGDIHFALPVTGVAAAQLNQGTVRALAVTSQERLPQWPEVPTLAESFNDDSYSIDSWTGLFAPAGTPREIVDKLYDAAVAAAQSPQHRAAANNLFTIVSTSRDPDDFAEFLRAESAKWRGIVSESGISPQ